ncbi:MAG: alanine dehydrogenase [Tannerella sp.]|jgi:alanine dehydrogenase|nr:alanine dehydrogenase [Tannerella sp.]
MIIGIPKEIKNNENRVAITPGGVKELVKRGHTVYVQHTAGENSGFSDTEYHSAGAKILPEIEEIYQQTEMILKVKEPIACEYPLVRKGQTLFTYFHFASEETLLKAMLKSGATCIAYETVETKDRTLPLLIPMSEVAGRMSIQEGAKYLEKPQGGKGILLGGVPGVKPAHILILGGGVVGYHAALVAAGSGAYVTIADISLPRLRYLDSIMPANVKTLYSSTHNIEHELPQADLVIGAVLIPGAKTPHLLTRDMLGLLKKGSVLVDVAIDQGGCFETSHPTTHTEPVYTVDGIVHYCVANIPGAVPYTSTLALTNATLPYVFKLADLGWKEACKNDPGLKAGVNVVDGKIIYPEVAKAFGLSYESLDDM